MNKSSIKHVGIILTIFLINHKYDLNRENCDCDYRILMYMVIAF